MAAGRPLDRGVPRSRQVATTGLLSGGGTFAADRTHAITPGTAQQIMRTNAGATAAEWATVSALLDAVLGSTRGMILRRGSSAWEGLAKGAADTVLAANSNDTLFRTVSDLFDAQLGSSQGAVAYRAGSVWAALASSTDDAILTSQGTGANPEFKTLSAIIDAVIGSTRGAILYKGSGGWVLRNPGAEGNVLTAHGTGADPTYDAPSGAGSLLRDVLLHQTGLSSHTWSQEIAAGTIANTNGSGLRVTARITRAGGATWSVKIGSTTVASVTVPADTGYGVLVAHIMRSASNTLEVTTHFANVDDSGSGGLRDVVAFAGGITDYDLAGDPFTLTIESSDTDDDVEMVLIQYVNGIASVTVIGPNDTTGTFTPSTAGMPIVHAVKHRSALGDYRLAAGISLTTVDAAVGSDSAEAGTLTSGAFARANDHVEFKGKEYLLHTNGTASHKVYERSIGGAWNDTAVRTETATTSSAHRTGLHVVNNGVTELLCFVWVPSGAGQSARLTTFDGTTWAVTTLAVATTENHTAINAYGVAACNGHLYIPKNVSTAAGSCLLDVDVFSATATNALSASKPAASIQGGVCCTIYGRVFYMTGSFNTSAQRQVYEYTGGSLVSRITLTSSGNDASSLGTSGFLMPYGDGMLAIYVSNTGATAANAFHRASYVTLDSPTGTVFTETVKAAILPAALEAVGAVSFSAFAYVDTESDPGSPGYHLFWSSGAAYSHGQIVDLDTEVGGTVSDADMTNYALPFSMNGDGGDRISPDDTDNVIFKSVSGARGAGVYTITFTLDAQTGGDTWTVKLWASETRDGRYAQATLTGSPTGGSATRVGSEIRGCSDNTAHSFSWDLDADGIADNTPMHLMLKAYRE